NAESFALLDDGPFDNGVAATADEPELASAHRGHKTRSNALGMRSLKVTHGDRGSRGHPPGRERTMVDENDVRNERDANEHHSLHDHSQAREKSFGIERSSVQGACRAQPYYIRVLAARGWGKRPSAHGGRPQESARVSERSRSLGHPRPCAWR